MNDITLSHKCCSSEKTIPTALRKHWHRATWEYSGKSRTRASPLINYSVHYCLQCRMGGILTCQQLQWRWPHEIKTGFHCLLKANLCWSAVKFGSIILESPHFLKDEWLRRLLHFLRWWLSILGLLEHKIFLNGDNLTLFRPQHLNLI